MNPIRIAIIILMLLAAMCGVSANNQPTKEELKKYAASIQAQLVLPKTGLKQGLDKKISFYFSVNERGEIEKVTAICADEALRKNLEAGFSRVNLAGFPAHCLSRIDLHYIIY